MRQTDHVQTVRKMSKWATGYTPIACRRWQYYIGSLAYIRATNQVAVFIVQHPGSTLVGRVLKIPYQTT